MLFSIVQFYTIFHGPKSQRSQIISESSTCYLRLIVVVYFILWEKYPKNVNTIFIKMGKWIDNERTSFGFKEPW